MGKSFPSSAPPPPLFIFLTIAVRASACPSHVRGAEKRRHFTLYNPMEIPDVSLASHPGPGLRLPAVHHQPFRVTAEYITANGMIFEGPDKPNYYFTRVVDGNGADAKANGWYVEGGWYIPNSKWELDARFDTMTRNTDRANQHTFDKWTLGVQYHFNPKTRLTVNYEMRDFKCDSGRAPCTSAGAATPNYNLDGVGDKVGVQLTAIF